MPHAMPSRLSTRIALAVAASLVAACGASRKVAEDRPLCERCHGGTSGNAAPPTAVSGATATSDPAVGAHQAHLVAGRLRGPVPCDECHTVPADMAEHEAGIAAIAAGTATRVVFGVLADKGAPVAAWNQASGTCANVYCHGATLGVGGANHEPPWTLADPAHLETACTSCHDYPPAAPHTALTSCGDCHSQTTPDGVTIRFVGGASTHIDGRVDLDSIPCSGGCTGCHAAPPATGAHLAHVASVPTDYGRDTKTDDSQPPTTTAFDFGCGSCHSVSCADHGSGIVDLTPAGATAGSLKSRNSAAGAYDQVTGRCDGVYCHSSGQEAPAFVPSPPWSGPPVSGPERCASCHGNPPSYVSGAAGSSTANGHVALRNEGGVDFAVGHFAGLPAVDHEGSAHGGGTGTQFAGDSAAPITCQTCHYRTADPGNTGPSGFYYLDTSGTYGVGPAFAGLFLDCIACHDGGAGSPAQGIGSAMPYFHVNGTRDVDFDPRTSLTIAAGMTLPAGADRPTRPYWYTRATTNNVGPPPNTNPSSVADNIASLPGGVLDGTTFSLELSGATWNPVDKSCSGVACHLNAANRAAIRWGEPPGTCNVCHNL